MPVLSETLSIALGIWVKVQYYHFDAGRAWRRKGKAADAAFFFAPGIAASGRVEAGRHAVVRRGWFMTRRIKAAS
jgi:hypothetical protein